MPRTPALLFALCSAIAGLAVSASAQLAQAQPIGSFRLIPPVSPACVSSPFGPRFLPGRPQAGMYHFGIDLPAPLGAPVRATAPGTVIRIERRGPGGLQMIVQHPGFVGVYSHFGSIAPVFEEGERTVAIGEKLGVVGLTGLTFGPHLYFGMIVGDRPIDPERFLGLPACTGGKPGVRVAGASVLARDGKILPSRAVAGRIPPTVAMTTLLRPAKAYLRPIAP